VTRSVLVTGGTGLFGVHVVRALIGAGLRVTLAGRDAGDVPAEVHDFVEADGERPGALVDVIARGGFECIVHLAALARTGLAEREPALAERLNAVWPGELAAAATAAGARFVHASTDLVFGARSAAGAGGFAPDEPTAPVGRYGASKAAGEAAVLGADPTALVVRLPLLFGDSLGRGLGASDGLFAALDCGNEVRLFTDELRTPLDVEAAAAALFVLMEADAQGTWHLSGRALSRYELGLALCHASGRDPQRLIPTTRIELGLESTRAADARLDTTATRAHFPAIGALLDSGSAPAFSKS